MQAAAVEVPAEAEELAVKEGMAQTEETRV
jgi:hypothetical protein